MWLLLVGKCTDIYLMQYKWVSFLNWDSSFLSWCTMPLSNSSVAHQNEDQEDDAFLNSLVGKDMCSQSYVLHVSGAAMDTILVWIHVAVEVRLMSTVMSTQYIFFFTQNHKECQVDIIHSLWLLSPAYGYSLASPFTDHGQRVDGGFSQGPLHLPFSLLQWEWWPW